MKKRILLIIGLAASIAFGVRGQWADSAFVSFRQSSTVLDRNFDRNGEHIDSLVQSLRKNTGHRPGRFSIVGGASPEGSVAFNKYLSEHRAAAIKAAVGNLPGVADSAVVVNAIGRDWSGLRQAVLADPDVPYRTEVLAMIDSIIAGTDRSGQDDVTRLKRLRGGVPYIYLYNTIFPSLRRSRIVVDYAAEPDLHGGVVRIHSIPLQSVLVPRPENVVIPEPEEPACRPLYLALKTNLLYDAAALPSIGFEAYVGKNWSVVGNWTYGWWDKDNVHRYWRAYGGDLAVRRWFGRKAAEKPLTGHHLGAYAGVVTYDFEFGGVGHMGGLPGRNLWDRCNYMAGIEYGYSLPVGRRLNIDFTLGLGYLGGKVIRYVPSGNFYLWQKTSHFNWVGPTKVEISLVWLIGCGNYNRKGGVK